MAIPWPLVERKRFKLLSSYQVVSSASAEVLSAPSLTLIKSLMLLAPSASAISRSLPRASIMPCVGKGNTQSLNRAKHQSTQLTKVTVRQHHQQQKRYPSDCAALPFVLRKLVHSNFLTPVFLYISKGSGVGVVGTAVVYNDDL